jgi:two-component system nitrogen regulation response regulator GlnG/two-component system response regulator HydG
MVAGRGDGDDASTLPPEGSAGPDGPRAPAETVGLAVLWSRDEPHRIGELLCPPPGDAGAQPWTFGRGGASGDERRLALVQPRPGAPVPTPPLRCLRVSRTQLRIAAAGGRLAIDNLGSCPLVHNGVAVSRADVVPGDLLALRNELLFLCVRRAAAAPQGPDLLVPPHAFGRPDAHGIVGESDAAWRLRQRIFAVARQHFHVLITGDSGSGKELVARAVHAWSPRARRAMVARNAATIPHSLAAAELFGNARNYPNAGMPERPGLIGEAHLSTLFLDEFAELTPDLQTHLLRVMDEGEYQRLGEATARKADLRVLAATNRPLDGIRPEILARLKVRIVVPDLNQRREDIPLLIAHLVRRHAAGDPLVAQRFFADGNGDGYPRVSPLLVERLVRHRYTSQVRELDALIVQALLESPGPYLDLGDLRIGASHPSLRAPSSAAPRAPSEIAAQPPLAGLASLTADERVRLVLLRRHRFSPSACGHDPDYPGNRQTADLHLRQLICRALAIADWEVARAADLLLGEADQLLRDRVASRVEVFLANLRERVAATGEERVRAALLDEWKGTAGAALLVLDALLAGKIALERA